MTPAPNLFVLDIPSYAQVALDVLESAGHSAYLVGGWVRDSIMGCSAHDVDISTSALWEQTAECFREAGYVVYETGVQHGTVSVNVEGNIIEVTTYRTESGYEDSRHPDQVTFVDNIELDLKRRDFTINAMAYNPKTGLIDLFGGVEDIHNRILRCVGDPSARFEEDALRILRAVRFATRLNFNVDPCTQAALSDSAWRLSAIAHERIGAELSAIFESGKMYQAMREFPEILVEAVPELKVMVGFDQKSQYHAYDCYEHTLRVVEAIHTTTAKAAPLSLRWAAFFHDFAKPETMYVDEEGQGHFPDHPEVSARIARKVMRRMALPSDLITQTVALVREHDETVEPNDMFLVRMLQRLLSSGVDRKDVGPLGFGALYLRQADALGKERDYRSYVSELDECKVCLYNVLNKNIPLDISDLGISGKDVLEQVCINPGPQVGEILAACLEGVITGVIGLDRDAQMFWLSHSVSREDYA